MANKYDKILDAYREEDGGSASASIQQYDTDPVAPAAEDAWVLRSGSGAIPDGTPIGLLLALTYTGNSGASTYQFSYYTLEGTTVRSTLV